MDWMHAVPNQLPPPIIANWYRIWHFTGEYHVTRYFSHSDRSIPLCMMWSIYICPALESMAPAWMLSEKTAW